MAEPRRRMSLRELIEIPFMLAWLLWKAIKILLVMVGLRRPRGRVGQLEFPAVLLGERLVIVQSAEELRANPLGLGESDRAALIDSAAQVFTLTNTHIRGGDLRAIWRIVVPKDSDYGFDLKWERSGLERAKKRLGANAVLASKRHAISSAATMADLIKICQPTG